MTTTREMWEESFREKKGQWVGVAVIAGITLVLFIWLGATGGFDPIPQESTDPQATEQQPEDTAARTALGDDVVKALNEAEVAAAIDGVTIYHVGEVTVTLVQAKADLGSDAEVSNIANGVAGIIFTNVPAADTVFVHDGNRQTIGSFSR